MGECAVAAAKSQGPGQAFRCWADGRTEYCNLLW